MKLLKSLLEMSNDGYSSREWAGDWCNDNPEVIQQLAPMIRQGDYDGLEHRLMQFFPDASEHEAKYWAAAIADYLVDSYEGGSLNLS